LRTVPIWFIHPYSVAMKILTVLAGASLYALCIATLGLFSKKERALVVGIIPKQFRPLAKNVVNLTFYLNTKLGIFK